jgi:molybdate transport system ATP-binding protein
VPVSEVLDLDLTLPLDRFTLRLEWHTDERALGIFGPSGSGKTSVLEAIAGLRPGARGHIRVLGRTWLESERGVCLAPERRGVGYVPQDARLFPHCDVRGNLLMGRGRARRSSGPVLDPDRVMEVLELGGRGATPVAALSGGERQRVALGRALCAGPDILLLDEPLGGLDLALRRRILPYLLRVEKEFGVPSIVVTHDEAEVRLLSREAVVLIAGEAEARGRAEDLFTGRHLLQRLGATGHTNILRGRLVSVGDVVALVELGSGLRLNVPGGAGLQRGEEVAVMVRAEELILAAESPHGLSAQNVLPGTVREVIETHPASRAHASARPTFDRTPPPGTLYSAAAAPRESSIAVTVVVPGVGAPLVAAVTAQAVERLGLAPGRPVFLVWKTHACQALPAAPPPLEETA